MLPANARFDTATMANPEMAEIVTGIQEADPSRQLPLRRIGLDADRRRQRFQRRHGRGSSAKAQLDNLDQLSLDIAHDIEAAWLELDEATPDQG